MSNNQRSTRVCQTVPNFKGQPSGTTSCDPTGADGARSARPQDDVLIPPSGVAGAATGCITCCGAISNSGVAGSDPRTRAPSPNSTTASVLAPPRVIIAPD